MSPNFQVRPGLVYSLVETPAGWLGLLASEAGLLRCSLPQPSKEAAYQALETPANSARYDPEFFSPLPAELEDYFRGEAVEFSCSLDFGHATQFERAVWEATRAIPPGETRSYGSIARRIGRPQSARAVGQALGRNPLPIIIPCHRVLRSDGGLGGFGGGLEMKRYLLNLERRNHEASGKQVIQVGQRNRLPGTGQSAGPGSPGQKHNPPGDR